MENPMGDDRSRLLPTRFDVWSCPPNGVVTSCSIRRAFSVSQFIVFPINWFPLRFVNARLISFPHALDYFLHVSWNNKSFSKIPQCCVVCTHQSRRLVLLKVVDSPIKCIIRIIIIYLKPEMYHNTCTTTYLNYHWLLSLTLIILSTISQLSSDFRQIL